MDGFVDLDGKGTQVLSRVESLRLLATQPVGRLVYTRGALPAVTPVGFTVCGEQVVFRAGRDALMSQGVRNALVGFEVDHYEPTTRSGWSVMVMGRARLVTEPAELVNLRETGPEVEMGDKPYFVTVDLEVVTGRRIAMPGVAA